MHAQRRKTLVALLSVLSNTVLVVFKLIVGLAINSVSVISEAIHSAMDLVAALIALLAVRRSSEPADDEHPFGHGKIENISSAVEAILIFVAAAWIIWESAMKLYGKGEEMGQVGWGVGVMFVSAVVNFIVSRLLWKVGRETHSLALQGDALHLSTDVWTSVGVMAGLGLIWANELIFKGRHFHWIDPVAAIGVALLIIHAAWGLTREACRDLLDVTLPPDEEQWIRDYLQRLQGAARGYHKLRTRKSGPTRFIEFHLFVDPKESVENSHRMTDEITRDFQKRFPGSDVTIHIEPYSAEKARRA